MLSADIIRELWEDHAEADKNLFQLLFSLLTLFFVFSMLYIISTTIDYLHQLCFLYMLNYPVIYSPSKKESGSKHAINSVYLSKTENSS